MRLRTQAARKAALAFVRNGLALAAVVAVAGGGYLGVRALIKGREALALENELSAHKKRAESVRSELARASSVRVPASKSDLSSVQRLQRALEKSCAGVGCSVTEFRSSAEVLPYLTRFAKATTAKGWSQVGAQAVLVGKPSHVMSAIGEIGESDVAFEFDSLEMVRDKVGPSGEATVRATLALRVLIRGEGRA